MRITRALGRIYLSIFTIMSCIVFLFICNLDISTSRIIDKIFDFGHLPLFGIISLGFVIIFKHYQKHANLRSYLYAWIITVILGIATELVQIITPERFFELGDILFDAIGAGCFLTLAYPFQDVEIRVRKIFRTVAIAAVFACTIPLLLAALDEISMHNSFPLIGSFESRLEMGRWIEQNSEITRSNLHPTNGKYSMKVRLLPGEYPGISLKYLTRNWQGYDRLIFNVLLEENNALRITVRIHDKNHNEQYEDRFNRGFVINPGNNTVIIDLKEVMEAPKGRRIDMGNIVNICIFSYNLAEQRTLYFDNFRLK